MKRRVWFLPLLLGLRRSLRPAPNGRNFRVTRCVRATRRQRNIDLERFRQLLRGANADETVAR